MRDKLDGKLYVEQYIHALTHELKSPVAAIRGAAEFLSDDVPAADRERFAASIREQAERIRIIAERLLELARVEQLHFVESPQPIELPSLIQDVLSELGAGIELQKLRIRVLGEAGATHGDPFLVRQAIRNLLENAIDFSPEGREILVFFAETHEFVEIQVVDEGVGIPDYAIDRVFDRFYSLARPHSGRKSTGLGLPFVKEVAKLHGGTVSLASRESGGTVALFRLRRT
jgi:two-component system sensor histidine kinase CreC